MRTFLDSKGRAEWAEQIKERKTPPLTEENVRPTFANLHAHRGEYFERGVIETFKSLSWDYRTNQPQAFGKRIIVRGVVGADGWPGSYSCVDKLDDLTRAFHVLDGTPEPDHRQGFSHRLWHREPRHAPVENAYMRVRTFHNGNAHVEFLRPDLVEQLNLILAKHYPDAIARSREAAPEPGKAPLAKQHVA